MSDDPKRIIRGARRISGTMTFDSPPMVLDGSPPTSGMIEIRDAIDRITRIPVTRFLPRYVAVMDAMDATGPYEPVTEADTIRESGIYPPPDVHHFTMDPAGGVLVTVSERYGMPDFMVPADLAWMIRSMRRFLRRIFRRSAIDPYRQADRDAGRPDW